MIRSNPFFTPKPHVALGQLISQTRAIQGAVANSLVNQGHEHVLQETHHLEAMLKRPLSPTVEMASQEKGHGLQAQVHRSRLGDTLKAFDQESRVLFASQPDTQTSLQALNQRQEQLKTRVAHRNELLDRHAAWSAATPPASSALDPIPVPALPPAPLSNELTARDMAKAIKHTDASDKEIAQLDAKIRQQPQPISQEEENIYFRQRNAMTQYRNAWATGGLKGSSQLKSNIGLSPERKHHEQELERSKQLASLELASHRLDRTVETAHKSGHGEKLAPEKVSAARDALTQLSDAWRDHRLDGSSSKGMNPAWFLTSRNERRLKLEQEVTQKAFVQLDARPRTEQPGSAQERLDFNSLIHSTAATHVKHAAINQRKDDNTLRAQVAELNTDLRNIYTDVIDNLALTQITKPRQ